MAEAYIVAATRTAGDAVMVAYQVGIQLTLLPKS